MSAAPKLSDLVGRYVEIRYAGRLADARFHANVYAVDLPMLLMAIEWRDLEDGERELGDRAWYHINEFAMLRDAGPMES